MKTRTEAAWVIADAVESAGYSASVWVPEGNSGPVRIYVTIPAASWKKKAQKIGYICVNLDGTIFSELEKQSGTIMALVPEMEIFPVEIKAAGTKNRPETATDEDVAAFESSARCVNAAEICREQG